jgi:3-oxoacyl-[acyl-carrier protein] reductase
MDLGLTNKVALVTGAAGGIGARTAQLLGEEGARVVVADINEAGAQTQATRLGELGITALAVRLDVVDQASVDAAIERIGIEFGGIDILVNNAGFTRDMRIAKMTEGDWDAVVDVVLKGAFLCSKAALPAMVDRRWGRVINISSRAYLGNPGQANYSAAKAGLLGLTKALAMEHGRFNITVNVVAPGVIDTPAVRGLAHFDKVRANAEANLPIPRLGQVEDVASAVAFLASEQASYVTGDVLHVTGGRYG